MGEQQESCRGGGASGNWGKNLSEVAEYFVIYCNFEVIDLLEFCVWTWNVCKPDLDVFKIWQEKLEKKRAEYIEKMKNKVAEVHKQAEEKRALVEANKREECLKVEETAVKFRTSGFTPRKLLGCFGS